jgi:predicted thioesterase
MKEGLSYTSRKTVRLKDTASYCGSGSLDVLATPALCALMENAALCTVAPCLQAAETTVGIALSVNHSKASPVGAQVCCTATLVRVDGKKLFFELTAHDECGEIGNGTHVRYVVNAERFMQKTICG